MAHSAAATPRGPHLTALAAPCYTAGGKEGRRAMERAAMLWDGLEAGRVRCRVCARRCVIEPGQRGFCQTRENRDGTLYSIVYGKPCTITV